MPGRMLDQLGDLVASQFDWSPHLRLPLGCVAAANYSRYCGVVSVFQESQVAVVIAEAGSSPAVAAVAAARWVAVVARSQMGMGAPHFCLPRPLLPCHWPRIGWLWLKTSLRRGPVSHQATHKTLSAHDTPQKTCNHVPVHCNPIGPKEA